MPDHPLQRVVTYAMVRPLEPGKVAYENSRACADHMVELELSARKQLAEGSLITGWMQELLPPCLRTGCEAEATPVVFVARDYGPTPRLEAIGACATHARQAESDLSLS